MNTMLASAMQQAYRNFFRNKMQEAGITAPSITQLGSRRAVAEFFNSIKEEWPVAKKAVEAKFAKALKDVKVGKNGKATLMASDYDYEPDFDVDHFLVNINSSEYDYLCDEFDAEYDSVSESGASKASAEAHKLGLKHAGFGKWKDKKGRITHMTVHGKLLEAKDARLVKKVATAVKKVNAKVKKDEKSYEREHTKAAKRIDGASDYADYGRQIDNDKELGKAFLKTTTAHQKSAEKIHKMLGQISHLDTHHTDKIHKSLHSAVKGNVSHMRNQTSQSSDYDYEPDFDVDHFLVNINSSEYDYLCDEFDEYDNTSESSGASLEAKKLKLIKIGFGRYATAKEPDKVAYITVHGRLCKAHIANKIKKVAQAIKHISKQHAEVIGKNSNKVMRLENKAKKLLSTLEKHDPIHAKKIQWNVLKGGNRRMYDSMNQKSTSATMSKDYDSKEAKRLLSKVEDSSGALLNYMINGVNDDPKLENAIDELSLECEHVLKKIKFIIGKL